MVLSLSRLFSRRSGKHQSSPPSALFAPTPYLLFASKPCFLSSFPPVFGSLTPKFVFTPRLATIDGLRPQGLGLSVLRPPKKQIVPPAPLYLRLPSPKIILSPGLPYTVYPPPSKMQTLRVGHPGKRRSKVLFLYDPCDAPRFPTPRPPPPPPPPPPNKHPPNGSAQPGSFLFSHFLPDVSFSFTCPAPPATIDY